MRNFQLSDFSGCGQYLVRIQNSVITDSGFLSTVLRKVGWLSTVNAFGRRHQRYCLIDESDGLTIDGYLKFKDNDGTVLPEDKRVWIPFEGKTNLEGLQILIDYLNNPHLSQEHRFATHEELIRVANYNKNRTKG